MKYLTPALESGKYVIVNVELSPYSAEYFIGYDFMGGDEWTTDIKEATAMDPDEADAVLADLKAADEIDNMQLDF